MSDNKEFSVKERNPVSSMFLCRMTFVDQLKEWVERMWQEMMDSERGTIHESTW